MTDFIEELLLEAEQKEKELQLAHVDLLLREVKKLEESISSNFSQAEEEKRIIDDWAMAKNVKLQDKIERITTQLKLFMDTQEDEVKTIDFAHGTLLRRKQPDKIEIVDLGEFLLNANSSMINLQPEIVKPNLNRIKAYYKMTQKVPQGTKLIEGKEKFSIKLKQIGEEENGKKKIRTGSKQTDSYRNAV